MIEATELDTSNSSTQQQTGLRGNNSYDRMGMLMGRRPELAIFRRFRALHAQVLLFRQAELTRLEQKIHAKQRVGNGAQNLADYQNSAFYQTHMQIIEEKLRNYCQNLATFRQVDSLPEPTGYDLWQLRQWIVDHQGGDKFIKSGEARNYIADELKKDLATTSDIRQNRDAFTTFVTEKATLYVENHFPSRLVVREDGDPESARAGYYPLEAHLKNWDQKRLRRVIVFIARVVTCGVPTVALFGLYHIPEEHVETRLGAVVAFSALFAACLAYFTNARGIEIAASVAGFASVQIVFVSEAGSTDASKAS